MTYPFEFQVVQTVKPIRVDSAVKKYLDSRTVKEGTRQVDRVALRNLVEMNNGKFVHDFFTSDIESYKKMLSIFQKPGGVNVYVRSIRTFFNTMRKWGHIYREIEVREIRTGDPDISYMTPMEAERFLSCSWQVPRMIYAVAVMRYTGMPRETVCSKFTKKDGKIFYRRGKSGKNIIVPISKSLAPYLVGEPDGEVRLYDKSIRNFNYQFAKIAKLADLPWVKPHTMRHTFATELLSKGVPIEVVSNLLGHTSIALTLKYYGFLVMGVKREAVDKL